jgi:hypothetical protein
MSQKSIYDTAPWTPEEDAVLISCWPDPDLDYVAIAALLVGKRTEGAILHRGSKIGLGPKARHKKARKPGKKQMAWPADMPKFEDHPRAALPGSRATAARIGSRVKSVSRDTEISLAGSSLNGAAINSTGRRV